MNKIFLIGILILLINGLVFANYSTREEARTSFLNHAFGNPLLRTIKFGSFDTGIIIIRPVETVFAWSCVQQVKGFGDFWCKPCGGCD